MWRPEEWLRICLCIYSVSGTPGAEACLGCGFCEGACRHVLEMDNDRAAETRVDPVPAEVEEAGREAVEDCPVEALSLES